MSNSRLRGFPLWNPIPIRPEALALSPSPGIGPSIRGIIRILLPIFTLLPIACRSPAPVSVPRPAPPPVSPLALAKPGDAAAEVWSSRPRSWDRLLVGLIHLPDRPLRTVKSLGRAKLYELRTGKLLVRVRAGTSLMLSPGTGSTVRFVTTGAAGTARALRLETGQGDFQLEGRRHTGSLLCWRAGERIACAVDIPIEAYLRGVLPGEVPAAWPLEAQKALAVAARTYAQASRGKHAAEGFDLCDGTHCQMYLGHVPGAARSERAVRGTHGLVALYGGLPIRAFYSADCGGRTANNEDVPFPDNPTEPMPYLRSVTDAPGPGRPDYCARSSHHHWTRLLSSDQIVIALNADPETAIGRLDGMRIAAVDTSGRARTMQIEGELPISAPSPADTSQHGGRQDVLPDHAAPPLFVPPTPPAAAPDTRHVSYALAGYAFRRAVGPRRLKSARFTLKQLSATQFRLSGSGYGHGVGLCQIGARGMALPPYRRTFRQILAHYYRGVTVAPFRPARPPP